MGYVILQALTALFASVGVFETVWQVILLCTRRSVQCRKTRVLIYANDANDAALLTEQWTLLSARVTEGDTEVWLLCDADDPTVIRAAEAAGVFAMTPEEAAERVAEEART